VAICDPPAGRPIALFYKENVIYDTLFSGIEVASVNHLSVTMSEEETRDYLSERDEDPGDYMYTEKRQMCCTDTKIEAIYENIMGTTNPSIYKKVAQLTPEGQRQKPSIVYSFFTNKKGIGAFAKYLDEKQWKPFNDPTAEIGKRYAIFDGKVNVSSRAAIIMAFNTQKIDVLLLGKAGAEGIDLNGGVSTIHIMEPQWTPAEVLQVVGRGQRFVSTDTSDRGVVVCMYTATLSVPVAKRWFVLKNAVAVRAIMARNEESDDDYLDGIPVLMDWRAEKKERERKEKSMHNEKC
jgi:superfamily II DNA or RNA helicase